MTRWSYLEIKLTYREKQVLILVSEGRQSSEIAVALGVSRHTVYNHRKRMLRKTNLENTMQLVVWAVKKGII